MADPLNTDEALAIAKDEVEKQSCLSDEEAMDYACGVLDGYEVAFSLLRPGTPLYWVERDIRSAIVAAISLRQTDADENGED